MRMLIAVVALAAALATSTPVHAAPTELDSGLGCSANCIRSALVTTSTNAAKIDVETDTPARFEVVIRKHTATGRQHRRLHRGLR